MRSEKNMDKKKYPALPENQMVRAEFNSLLSILDILHKYKAKWQCVKIL